MAKLICLLAALLLGNNVWAADVRVPIPNHDDLVLSIPEGWKAEIRTPRPDLPPTVAIASAKEGELEILITPLWPVDPSAGAADRGEIRKFVQEEADAAKPQSVEPTLPLVELSAPGKIGYYFAATDKAPEPGGFKYLTQGAVGFDELRVTFTILANGEPKSVTERTLQILKAMRREPGKNPAQ